ncbi:pentapeptide repeat-containing protein [Streptomyces sp. NPDC004579]|uniref:pentapeptide repeat-containing protein n=1 Tax=Streptomyces sp. NPDC004579 TaxID=3154667 RepID=UPI0033B0A853
MSTPPAAPSWPHCAHGADPATDPVGCRGIHVAGHTACLAHLADADRHAYLAGLTPGASIDHRGTTFTDSLLIAFLNSLRDPSTGNAHLGDTEFESATFKGNVGFESATFEGETGFESATFKGVARFESATFKGYASFESARFEGDASFESARFEGDASFESARFEGDASFESARFEGDAVFGSASFKGYAVFGSATFKGVARFESATFEGNAVLGSATFEGYAEFESATFEGDAGFGWATFEGDAGFELATFEGYAVFRSATFESYAEFGSVTFKGDAGFESATFKGYAGFESATFESDAEYESATFKGYTRFESVTFKSYAVFRSATFEGDTGFESVTFKGYAGFESTTFKGNVGFESATFERADQLGPLACAGRVELSGAVFSGPVTLAFAACRLECRRTRWSSTAEIRLRYATVDFAHAVFEYPLTIVAEPDPFVLANGGRLAEDPFQNAPDPGVRVASLRGVDAAHLVLADLDLSGCLFAGTVHLDQLRLEGACIFDTAPPAVCWRRWPPVRFTERRLLAEEQHWRASQPQAVRGWNTAVFGAGRVGPLQLAPVYRALRKAFEDGKHEPGAADFYYGEMEMRRHAGDIPRSERSLLTAYWALSGYGLRASRALAWLGAAMLLTIVLLMAFGLAQDTPKQTATGTVPAGGGKVTFEIDKDDPQNPTGNRFTGERFEKSLSVTLNSVVFRSSGQDLTTAGTYIEMTSRLTEPVLLGLAVLAVRNRVKR